MLSAYLSARPAAISICSPLFPSLSLDTVFPAPNPKPQILRNITIKDMMVKPSSNGTIFASGIVFAYGVLPKGMNVILDISRVFPDILVFDGPVPENATISGEDGGDGDDDDDDEDDDDLPAPMPLPDPLPERAFARIRPGKWLEALSVPVDPPEGEGSAVAVSAILTDVALEVLPGRKHEFSNFVGKVWFFFPGRYLAGLCHLFHCCVGDFWQQWCIGWSQWSGLCGCACAGISY
jgi:hypothetical protein